MSRLREQIRSMLRVETREGGFRAVMEVDAQLVVFADHFPGQPILPGVCMIQAVLLAGEIREGCGELRLREVRKAKWLRPVRPGERIEIEGDMTSALASEFVVKAKLSVDGKRCAEFSLVARVVAEGVVS